MRAIKQAKRSGHSNIYMRSGEGKGIYPDDEGMSPAKANLIRPRYAKKSAANLPEVVKPETGGEAMSMCIHRADRGG